MSVKASRKHSKLAKSGVAATVLLGGVAATGMNAYAAEGEVMYSLDQKEYAQTLVDSQEITISKSEEKKEEPVDTGTSNEENAASSVEETSEPSDTNTSSDVNADTDTTQVTDTSQTPEPVDVNGGSSTTQTPDVSQNPEPVDVNGGSGTTQTPDTNQVPEPVDVNGGSSATQTPDTNQVPEPVDGNGGSTTQTPDTNQVPEPVDVNGGSSTTQTPDTNQVPEPVDGNGSSSTTQVTDTSQTPEPVEGAGGNSVGDTGSDNSNKAPVLSLMRAAKSSNAAMSVLSVAPTNNVVASVDNSVASVDNGAQDNGTVIDTSTIEITSVEDKAAAQTEAVATPVRYEYYQQNADDDDYTLYEMSLEESDKSYKGFHSTETINVTKEDGSVVRQIYYDRNIYQVEFYNSITSEVIKTIETKYGANTYESWYLKDETIQRFTDDLNYSWIYAWKTGYTHETTFNALNQVRFSVSEEEAKKNNVFRVELKNWKQEKFDYKEYYEVLEGEASKEGWTKLDKAITKEINGKTYTFNYVKDYSLYYAKNKSANGAGTEVWRARTIDMYKDNAGYSTVKVEGIDESRTTLPENNVASSVKFYYTFKDGEIGEGDSRFNSFDTFNIRTKYDVTFNTNDGKDAETKEVISRTDISGQAPGEYVIGETTREDESGTYIFDGWTDAYGKTFDLTKGITGNTILKAIWKVVTPDLSTNLDSEDGNNNGTEDVNNNDNGNNNGTEDVNNNDNGNGGVNNTEDNNNNNNNDSNNNDDVNNTEDSNNNTPSIDDTNNTPYNNEDGSGNDNGTGNNNGNGVNGSTTDADTDTDDEGEETAQVERLTIRGLDPIIGVTPPAPQVTPASEAVVGSGRLAPFTITPDVTPAVADITSGTTSEPSGNTDTSGSDTLSASGYVGGQSIISDGGQTITLSGGPSITPDGGTPSGQDISGTITPSDTPIPQVTEPGSDSTPGSTPTVTGTDTGDTAPADDTVAEDTDKTEASGTEGAEVKGVTKAVDNDSRATVIINDEEIALGTLPLGGPVYRGLNTSAMLSAAAAGLPFAKAVRRRKEKAEADD